MLDVIGVIISNMIQWIRHLGKMEDRVYCLVQFGAKREVVRLKSGKRCQEKRVNCWRSVDKDRERWQQFKEAARNFGDWW